jgi:hypothetical protein
MNSRATAAVLTLALALCAVSTVSHAEDCRMYPPGPQRFACASQRHPGLLIKAERCKEEGQAMGLLPGKGGRFALHDFVMACMHRKG